MSDLRRFTDLERDVFELICATQPELAPRIRQLLVSASVTQRENTGHGFFTDFETDGSAPPIDWPLRLIDGPNRLARMGDFEFPIGFIL